MTLPERADREGDSQHLPVVNDRGCIQDLVAEDLLNRKAIGIKRYGTVLQPHNGRNAALDLYEELVDGAVYARQVLEEWKEVRIFLQKIADEGTDYAFQARKLLGQ